MDDNERSFVDNELRLTCADAVELVTDFLDDALSVSDLEDFVAHLSLCEGCQAFLDQTRRTIRLVSETSHDTIEVLPANFDRLAELLRQHHTT